VAIRSLPPVKLQYKWIVGANVLVFPPGLRHDRERGKPGRAMKQIAILVVVACCAASGATAQSQDEQQACTNDAFQFCQNAIPDRTRVFTCLAENRHVISPACQLVMAPYLPPEPVVKKPVRKTTAKNKAPLKLSPQ
jgi:hypothetical protein